jgi:hypothetical protein
MFGLAVIGNAYVPAQFMHAPNGDMTAMAGVWIVVDGGTIDMPSGIASIATTRGARRSRGRGDFATLIPI